MTTCISSAAWRCTACQKNHPEIRTVIHYAANPWQRIVTYIFFFSTFPLNHIPDAAYGADNVPSVAQFLPQALDMHVDSAAFAFIRKSPYGFHNLFAFQHDVYIDQKIPQQFEFLDRQMAWLAVDSDDVFFAVEGYGTERIHVAFPSLRLAAAQDGPYAGYQLDDAEGLADVIVGAAVQPADDVVFAGLCRQHDDRKRSELRVFSNFIQYFRAAFSGKHDVQQHQSRYALLHSLPEFLAVGKGFYFKILAAQGVPYEFTYIFIIFDTINQRHVLTS